MGWNPTSNQTQSMPWKDLVSYLPEVWKSPEWFTQLPWEKEEWAKTGLSDLYINFITEITLNPEAGDCITL